VPDPAPSPELVRASLAAAARRLVEAHLADPRFAGATAAALAERWLPVPAPPRPVGGGWWEVGRIPDESHDWRVLMHPRRRRARLAPVPLAAIPDPPAAGGRYFDGCLLRWVDPGEQAAG
jgi:hypothetical protein